MGIEHRVPNGGQFNGPSNRVKQGLFQGMAKKDRQSYDYRPDNSEWLPSPFSARQRLV